MDIELLLQLKKTTIPQKGRGCFRHSTDKVVPIYSDEEGVNKKISQGESENDYVYQPTLKELITFCRQEFNNKGDFHLSKVEELGWFASYTLIDSKDGQISYEESDSNPEDAVARLLLAIKDIKNKKNKK